VTPVRRLLIGASALIAASVGFAAGRSLFRPKGAVAQPIAFSHEKHVQELEIGCKECHQYYETSQHSGLPTLTTCKGCHEEPLTDKPEERKIQTLAGEGQDDVFRKLFRLPDHAYYSHRRHVAAAGIDCETCHGGIAHTTEPPEAPLVRITMGFCLDCHQRSGVSSDCTRCHR
jgi:cytochrome c553